MYINVNKLEFFPGANQWIDVCYDNEYIESIRPYSKNRICNVYYTVDKLLDMRNCEVVYLHNLYAQGGEWEFNQVKDKLNKKLINIRGTLF